MLAFRLYGCVDDPIGYVLVITGYPRMSYRCSLVRRQTRQDSLAIAMVTLVTVSLFGSPFLFRQPATELTGENRAITEGEIRER